ncbi:hypothetical protein N7470_002848, partial [Penicillium chermesinum]
WNRNDDFFKFTRGRFIVDEAENLREREVRFDMNKLAQVAADSVGATRCVSIKKYPDGMFNKAFLMSMENGQEVVAKVPNPNAGIPHFTTASEVATMDFARSILQTPTPHVYTWNSHAKSHPVGAEFIIMDKIEGVPLSQVWEPWNYPERLPWLLAMTSLQKEWLSVSFSHYGSLYYTKDVQPLVDNHIMKNGRDWVDAGRSTLDIERGPWNSLTQYLHAIGIRETLAIKSLRPPKQTTMFCGPGLYQPDAEKKITALKLFQQIIDILIPSDTAINVPSLWHHDLHTDNILVDPLNPGKITGIIDWQSCQISPLFYHSPDPAFIELDGPEPKTLDLVPLQELSGLSADEQFAALEEFTNLNVFIGWRNLMWAKNPNLYQAAEFRKTTAFGLMSLACRMFEYGEAHFLSLLVDLKDIWAELPAVKDDIPFPFDFSREDFQRIRLDCDGAEAGTQLVGMVKERMGNLWPQRGFIGLEQYDDCKAILDDIKDQTLKYLAETDEEKAEYERYWPFE